MMERQDQVPLQPQKQQPLQGPQALVGREETIAHVVPVAVVHTMDRLGELGLLQMPMRWLKQAQMGMEEENWDPTQMEFGLVLEQEGTLQQPQQQAQVPTQAPHQGLVAVVVSPVVAEVTPTLQQLPVLKPVLSRQEAGPQVAKPVRQHLLLLKLPQELV